MSQLFTRCRIGNLELENRAIRAAAFEGMCPGNRVSENLIRYHRNVAAGGTAMTTVAYAAVCRSGLSFHHQLLLDRESVDGLRKLTDAVHGARAAVSIQIGHCGLMADRKLAGKCLSPSGGFNLYGPTWPVAMKENDIREIISAFGAAVRLSIESGFDAVEVHAGHGYLVSQFLSPYTNRRRDSYGGSFVNRSRFLAEVIREVIKSAAGKIAVMVKMNLSDGFPGGMELDESILTAQLLEREGVDALVLSGGFVARSPMYILRGKIPADIMAAGIKNPWMRTGTRLFGGCLMGSLPFSEGYFLDDARVVRQEVGLPLVAVGGMKSKAVIEKALHMGFDFVQIGRALIHDPGFTGKLKRGEVAVSGCETSNYCIARMYSRDMRCYQYDPETPSGWKP